LYGRGGAGAFTSCIFHSCNPFIASQCLNIPLLPATPCDDNLKCTDPDACIAPMPGGGSCVGQPKCNDNNPCTNDACDPATGNCSHANNNAQCSDNNACTTGDQCSGGACQPGIMKNCNDNNACTTDSCDPATGNCANTPMKCDDNNPCTSDACDP